MPTLWRIVLLGLGLIVLLAPASAEWREAGPIWADADAQRKCPNVCGRDKWDGQWKTTQIGRMSVCQCRGGHTKSRDGGVISVDAGPIWNNFDAKGKCVKACGGRRWDGNWRTVSPGRSTCDCLTR